MDFFMSRLDLTKDQAAGIVANLIQESALRPKAQNNGAIGIAQWRGSRQKEVLDLYNTEHPDNTYSSILDAPLDAQLEMVSLELTKGGKNIFFKNYKNNEYNDTTYADAVLRGYEFGGNGTLATQDKLKPEWGFDFGEEKIKRDAIFNSLIPYSITKPEKVSKSSVPNYTATPEMVLSNPVVQINYSKEFLQLHEDFILTNQSLAILDENIVNGLNNLAANNNKGQTQVNITSAQSFTT